MHVPDPPLGRWKRTGHFAGIHTYTRSDKTEGLWYQLVQFRRISACPRVWKLTFRRYGNGQVITVLDEEYPDYLSVFARAKAVMAMSEELLMEEVL